MKKLILGVVIFGFLAGCARGGGLVYNVQTGGRIDGDKIMISYVLENSNWTVCDYVKVTFFVKTNREEKSVVTEHYNLKPFEKNNNMATVVDSAPLSVENVYWKIEYQE